MGFPETPLLVLLLLAGAVPAIFGLYLLIVAVAAFFLPRAEPAGTPRSRVAILVPAHDEAALIGRCVQSLRAQRYPDELYEVVVIADNCTDDTAALARAAGARVLERDALDARGKGQALRWAMERILPEEPTVDAIAVVDADTVADPEFLARLVQRFELGAPAVQGESLLLEDGSSPTALRVAAFLLINRARPSGRAVLGLPCSLCGNGMLLGRELLAAHPWSAFSATEDLEYALTLRRAGIGPVFARGAVLLSPAAPNAAAATHQQLRWEGGKTRLARSLVPRLVAQAVRERRPSLLDAAFELALPPLGLLMGAGVAGAAAATPLVLTGAVPAVALLPWLVVLVSVPLFVLAGLAAAGAPATSYRALAGAPLLVARKAVRLPRLLRFRADSWVRTER
jgi:hypothetical protein